MNKDNCIKTGDKAPDFILYDQNQKEFKLSSLKGKRILLSFHPLAWTSVCALQMKSLEDNLKSFKELNTVAVGVSIDSAPSKKAWAESLDIKKTRFLADFWPHGKVAGLFGIFRENYSFFRVMIAAYSIPLTSYPGNAKVCSLLQCCHEFFIITCFSNIAQVFIKLNSINIFIPILQCRLQ